MHKILLALGRLAAPILMAGCAANQSAGFVPPSSTSARDGTANAASLEHVERPDVGSSIAEFNFAATSFDFITPDLAGNEWFGSVNPIALVAIGEQTGVFKKFPLPSPHSGPLDLATNPQHDVLWFTEPGANAIGYMNLLNNTVGQFTVPTHNSYPEGISAGPGDHTMWFTETGSGKIGRIDTITQKFTEYSLPSPSKPYRITLGPDGALWFTNQRSIGRITMQGHIHLYSIGLNDATGITAGPDGGVWFTGRSDHNGSLLGRIDPNTHVRKLYKYAGGDGGNQDLTVRDSDFWMTRTQGNRIDRFDHTTHLIHSRLLPQGYSRPLGIALGSDKQLWFVNDGPKPTAIGKLCPGLAESLCKGSL